MPDTASTRRELLKTGGAALVTGLAGCASDSGGSESSLTRSTVPQSETPQDPTSASAPSARSAYTEVYRQTIDSVVLVQTDQGQGSGFVYDDSHVVTNAHVVGQAAQTDIRFNEGRWSTGDVVGTDPHSDLAVIAVDDIPPSSTPLRFIDGTATVGQEVVAIGNPFSLDGSVTTGIVSGVDRSIPAPTGFRIPDAIQTDAAVNPGNSGGPLMSLDGRVVAVINSGGGDNIAFGISAALARRVLPRLIESGTYDHPYLGISLSNVTPEVARANDLNEPRGLLVVQVVGGGPADGVLRPSTDVAVVDGTRVRVGGDIIVAIDGTQLKTVEDLNSYVTLQTRPGDTVDLTVLRDGTERTVSLELGTRPA